MHTAFLYIGLFLLWYFSHCIEFLRLVQWFLPSSRTIECLCRFRWPIVVWWRNIVTKKGSTLAPVTAWRLMAPSHCLYQYWLIICDDNFTTISQYIYIYIYIYTYILELSIEFTNSLLRPHLQSASEIKPSFRRRIKSKRYNYSSIS